jgi:2-dehydro-3-deoxyglucarate aldolase
LWASAPVVRPPWSDTVVIKRLPDAGFLNVLVPFVDSAEQARQVVAAAQAIAAVDGVDALFVGPSGLAAAYVGFGQPNHPEVQEAIAAALAQARAAGKPVGGPQGPVAGLPQRAIQAVLCSQIDLVQTIA